MKVIIFLLIVSISAFCFAIIAYKIGRKHGSYYLKNREFGLCYLQLEDYPEKEKSTEIYNWLKGRYYYLSRDVSNSDFKHSMKDFGPVDTNVLQYPFYGSECNPEKEYNDFKKIYDKLKESQQK